MDYDQRARDNGLCGNLSTHARVCTLTFGHELAMHMCVTPARNPAGICTEMWRDNGDYLEPDLHAQLTDTHPHTCALDPETQAAAIIKIAEYNTMIDTMIDNCRRANLDDTTLVLLACKDFYNDFGRREHGLHEACELAAVLTARLVTK